MKAKTARRFLNRNAWKISVRKLDGKKRQGFVKTCLKVLSKDRRNPASVNAHNRIVLM